MVSIIQFLSFENFCGTFTCRVEPLSKNTIGIYKSIKIAGIFLFWADYYVDALPQTLLSGLKNAFIKVIRLEYPGFANSQLIIQI